MMKKIAVVSGGANGIGLAVSARLAADGYEVVMADLDPAAGKKAEAEIPGAVFFLCNVSKQSGVSELFGMIAEKYGRIDLLVNNAGIIRDNLIWKMTEDDFDAVIEVNLKGTWMMCREAARMMKEQQQGRIVNIASRAWLGNRGQTNYSASKAGIVGMTRSLALELGKYGVCVNAVAPGLIDTPLTRRLRPDVLDALIQAQPTKTIGKPSDIASAVAFLGSFENAFITGQVIYVDGGKSIGANMV